MYIEERIDQLENITVDHGNQIDMIATALATLTIAVQNGFAEAKEQFARIDLELTFMHNQFIRIDKQFTDLNGRVDSLEGRIDRLEVRMDSLEVRMDRLEVRMGRLEGRMERLETKMDQRFDEIILLIKSKL